MRSKSESPLKWLKSYNKKTLTVLQLILLVIFGSMYVFFTWASSSNEISKQSMNKATTVATMINDEMLKKLNAAQEDVGTIAYESVKKRLIEWVKSNGEIRFAYIYTQKEDKLFFMVDSEPATSKDCSPPGQEYTEADQAYSKPFLDGQELITPPVTDRWGTWVSVIVPIKDSSTGKTMAILAMDYPAKMWNDYARNQSIKAVMLVLALTLLIFALIVISNKKEAAEMAKEALVESERNKSVILSNLPGMSYRCSYDTEWTMEFVSEGCYELTGYKPKDFLYNHSLSYNDIILPEDREHVRKSIDQSVHSRERARFEYRICTADHKEKWVWEQEIPIFDVSGKVEAVEGLIMDVSVRKKLEVDLSNEMKLLETTLISVGDGVISTDRMGNVVFLNKVAEFLTGWKQEAAKGKSIEQVFDIVNELTHEKSENIIQKVIRSRKILEIANHTILISKDGTERPIEDSAAPILQENGEIIGVVLVFRDVSDKKQRREEIEFLSYHDQLTGLYNRRFYDEELRRLDTKRNLPLTIVMGDVNGLKLINDSFGHALGDEVLKKVADIIMKGFRTDDIVARLGGDEFVILLPKTDTYEVEQIIKRITDLAMKEKVGSVDISISFGYQTKNKVEDDIQEIFKNAEDYLYKKKLFEGPSMRGKTIKAIIHTLYEKNKREEQHSHRVSALCISMGEALGLPEREIEELKSVGLLHDIGKIAIDENVLNKPGTLSEDEWKEIKRHPEVGYRILSTANDMADMAKYVLYHHERWNGTGYPKGLKGEEIPLQSRIIAIADAYDAMTSTRSYRGVLSVDVAIEELKENAGVQFDPELVSVFVETVLNFTSKY